MRPKAAPPFFLRLAAGLLPSRSFAPLFTPVAPKAAVALFLSFLLCPCAVPSPSPDRTVPAGEGYETYRDIREMLHQSGDNMDYETLMEISGTMIHPPHPVPHVDQLLLSLMNKRNEDPRVDQMILIFSSQIIGNSRFPVPDVYRLFESIISMEDARLNEWVISFIGAAIGNYPFEIPEGDRLVDLLEQRLDQIESLSATRESFGCHFLPPPTSPFIRSYIAGIGRQDMRETERRCYYALIVNNMTEEEIETGVKRLQQDGIPGTGAPCRLPMQCLLAEMN